MKVDYKDNSQQVLSALEKGIKNGLEAIGLTAETYAKKATPVDTGRLGIAFHTLLMAKRHISDLMSNMHHMWNWEQAVPKRTICCRKPQRSTAQSTNGWQKMHFTTQSTTYSNIHTPNISAC